MVKAPESENIPNTLLEKKVGSVKSESRVANNRFSRQSDGNDNQDDQMDLDSPKANASSADHYGWFNKYNNTSVQGSSSSDSSSVKNTSVKSFVVHVSHPPSTN